MEACCDEDVRVRHFTDIVIGRIAEHVVKVLPLVGIAPLLPLPGGQGDRGVAHGVHHIHKGNACQRHTEEVRPHVQGAAEEQAAGAPALDREPVRRGDAQLDQALGAGDEVHEGVALGQVLALLLVPVPPHLAAPPDAGNAVDHAAVQVRERVHIEGRVNADAVGAVAVEQAGPGPGAPLAIQQALQVHHAHRDLRAVGGLREDAPAGVLGRVEARHLLPPDGLQALRGRKPQVAVIVRLRCRERAVYDAQVRRVGVLVCAYVHLVELLLELEPPQRGLGQRRVQRPDAREAAFTALYRHVVPQRGDALDANRRPVWKNFFPGLLAALLGQHRVHGNSHEPVVDGPVLVRPEEEAVADVLDVVAEPKASCLHEPQRTQRARGEVQDPDLVRLRRPAVGHEEPPAGRLLGGKVEEFVLLGEKALVAGLGLAQDVAPELPGPLGRVLGGVEDDRVAAPLHAPADALEPVLQNAARRQVREDNRVRLVAREVYGVGKLCVVRAGPHAQDHALLPPLGHLVLVQQHLLLRLRRGPPDLGVARGSLAAVNLVGQTLYGPRVVEPGPVAVRSPLVGLLHVRDVLGVELLPQFR
mmetsp:Transcript_105899/g.299352  ORF Transcript_105899/g.299352 Transcript_105899/m.299352 type:complete len:587 (-) Transcript_105899:269-2029(-)